MAKYGKGMMSKPMSKPMMMKSSAYEPVRMSQGGMSKKKRKGKY